VLVRLSDEGWELFAAAIREANVVESDVVAPLTDSQTRELASLLEKLIEGLD
jgi:DNA-binding MarR family transcriptional regulator